MKRIVFLFLVVFQLNSMTILAQTGVFELLNRDQYMAKVKLVDEFFARFNGEETRKDLGPEYSDRESGILLLFDFAKFKSKTDSNFIAAKTFAHNVAGSGIKINFEDNNWFAKIKCHGSLGQKKVTFNMLLCVEERDSGMYRWAISDVEGDIFNNSRDKAHKEFFIMPNDNEQFFMSVRKTTTDTYKFIDDYAVKGYKADALSTFLALVRCNFLKIDAVTDVEFIFMQVPGYIFNVKHFERESKNSGWLIDSISKCNEEEKNKIHNHLHCCENNIESASSSDTVREFFMFLSDYCKTGNIELRTEIEKLCGTGCRVNDKIVEHFVQNHELNINNYTMPYYLNGFENLRDSITIKCSGIEFLRSSDKYDYVISVVNISGKINLCTKDVFCIRKKDGKIIKIEDYESCKL